MEIAIDPWATSGRPSRLVLGLEPSPKQLDLFKREAFASAATHWARLVARAVNAELPSLSRQAGVTLAPLPIDDLVAFLRKGRWPDPTDPLLLVPIRVWELFLATVSNPSTRPKALRAGEQIRMAEQLKKLADYAAHLFDTANADPIVRHIGIKTRPLTYNNIKAWFLPLPTLLQRELTQAESYNLLRAIRAELRMRVAFLGTQIWVGHDVARLRFAGIIEYVADLKRHEVYLQAVNDFGDMQRVAEPVDTNHPLKTTFWLLHFLDHWLLHHGPAGSPQVNQILRAWLASCLFQDLDREQLRPRFIRALLDGFKLISAVKPEIDGLRKNTLPIVG